VHVDRAVRQWPLAALVASAEPVDDDDRSRLALLGGCGQLRGFVGLLLAVAVDLADRDL